MKSLPRSGDPATSLLAPAHRHKSVKGGLRQVKKMLGRDGLRSYFDVMDRTFWNVLCKSAHSFAESMKISFLFFFYCHMSDTEGLSLLQQLNKIEISSGAM